MGRSDIVLMVIFGAGASYDSSADCPPQVPRPERPPLANDLFVDREQYRQFRNRYPQFLDLIAELIPKTGRSIEDVLQRLQHEEARNPYRKKQLTAIRFYLKDLLAWVSSAWLNSFGEVTNFRTLIDQIENHRKDDQPVCLVTFNYDTLLESALGRRLGMPFEVMDDYVRNSQVKLFKLHGSVDWGHPLVSGPLPVMTGKAQLIDYVADITVSDQIVTNSSFKSGPLYPAIAIPVTEKRVFECPAAHVALLKELIPKITKVITIGWRGSEAHFLELLRNLGTVSIITVAGSELEAAEPLDRIRQLSVPISTYACLPGFSDTVGERKLDAILQE